MELRLANLNDAREILNIYKYYIENTAITFEYKIPSLEEFENRVKTISKDYPYIVALIDNKIIGYAYASKYKERDAYNWDVELSIYANESYHNKNIASTLYSCILDILKLQGFYNVYACITVPNIKSEKFHKKHGFNLVGCFSHAGFKFNKWWDIIWMEKNIIDFNIPPKPIKHINLIKNSEIQNIFNMYV
ncbi:MULTISPECIES: GNAT family N-acetyltransferase [unclassified Romboutsia]|uniref:GNAT family N-acetyltransferase n=1 Tax=unclassified Romboutsia TaxID=2626894 RepID=UPI0008219D57|nr:MULTISPECIES: GNAT family N-acetyltransferase [unclassified Romboutsia]SCH16361.1 Phosphinothricin N-acetyltransferase [uncultured Clostridium sp.]